MSDILTDLIDREHESVPVQFSTTNDPLCAGGCVGCLTRLNFLWTNGVRCHNQSSTERPVMLSYGRTPLPYDKVTLDEGASTVLLTGHLGRGTATSLWSVPYPSTVASQGRLIMMSYVRFDNHAMFALVDPSLDDGTKQRVRLWIRHEGGRLGAGMPYI